MKKPKASTLRVLSATAVVAVVCVGLAVHTGLGTPSSFGIYDIAALCPLGAIEAAIASKTVVPPLLIGAAIFLGLTVLLGRAFCAWGCPVPLLRRLFGLKSVGEKRGERTARAASRFGGDIPPAERGGANDSRNWVLGGTVLTTALFGFPVFCLICPVGLTFATLIALWRLVQFSETTLSLLVFPALLVVEVVVLRKWCHKFCPLGALLSLTARLNRTFRPVSNASTCLQGRGGEGASCHRCTDACPEGIDLHHGAASAPLHECTRCRSCADACPVQAISFPLLDPTRRRAKAGEAAGGVPASGTEDEEVVVTP